MIVLSHSISEKIKRSKPSKYVPYVSTIVYLTKKEYSKVYNKEDKMDMCLICLDNYRSNDQIIELLCDERHFFHDKCTQDWFKTKPACPICKT